MRKKFIDWAKANPDEAIGYGVGLAIALGVLIGLRNYPF